MRKLEITEEQISEIIKLYVEEGIGLRKISMQILGRDTKEAIKRILIENNISIFNAGQRYKGGRKEADKRYYKKHKKVLSTYHKNWAKNNSSTLKTYHQEWRDDNREQVNSQKRDRARILRKTDPFFRLNQNFKTALWTALKEKNIKKNNHTFDLLGYSLNDLVAHLEAKFQTGMTWDNYGEWHVDHKLPISSFNFTSTEDKGFKICWGLNNLQPLWEGDNLSKGKKII